MSDIRTINSSGTKLSIFDLMVAATWAHRRFDLNDEAKKIASSLRAKGFEGISRDTILRCLTAVRFSGVKKKQILDLRNLAPEEKDELVAKTRRALLRAVDILSTEFGVWSWDFLPYEAVLVILCATLAELKTLTSEKVVRLRQWFWRASFGERYRVGGENFVTSDIKNVLDFIKGETDDPTIFGEIPGSDRLLKAPFRTANSRSRAFMLALAMRKPRNITNGATIDVAEALSAFNRKQFHHIFPTAYLKRSSEKGERNSLVNICMLAASENNRVRDADPHIYIPECAKELGGEARTVFASNLLPAPSEIDYATSTYDQFLETRARVIAEYVCRICSGQVHP